jgi:hypothetical protein
LLNLNDGLGCASDGRVGESANSSPNVDLCVRGVKVPPEDDLTSISNPRRTSFLRGLAAALVELDEDLPALYRCAHSSACIVRWRCIYTRK